MMVLRGSFDPPMTAGFVLPLVGPVLSSGQVGLPVEKGAIDILCDRASNAIGGRISNVQSVLPRWLMRFLGGVIERALRLGERRTCSDGVVESPRGVVASRRDGSSVWLGHEEFQYRAFALGQNPASGKWKTGERGVGIAAGRRSIGGPSEKLQQLGRLSFAQAEYYHHADVAKSEWLWKLRWRARLRRFGVSKDLLDGLGIRNACSQASRRAELCALLEDLRMPNLSVH
jgi:hypothetical protein